MFKNCIQCGVEKPLEEYYIRDKKRKIRHNKCKECIKLYASKRNQEIKKNSELLQRDKKRIKDWRLKKSQNRDWVENEKKKGRLRYHLLNLKEKNKLTSEYGRMSQLKHFKKYPEKYAARCAAAKLPKTKGQNHHWSYNEEHYKDIIPMAAKDHKKAHRFLIYDQERMMYRRYDTMELLDTKEKHKKFINFCILNKED